MQQPAIEISNLNKAYADKIVIHDVSLTVKKGEIFALLGPNGAGKTTIVEILEGHRFRDHGSIQVLGYDPARNERAFKQRVGMVLQSTGIDPYLTVEETLRIFRSYYQKPMALDVLIELTQMSDLKNTRVRKLSGGQQRKLDVAVALCGNPEVLFLDEPTTGFDPTARRRTWEMLQDLKQSGMTIFLTTHYMEEAEALADQVGFIVEGDIVEQGSLHALTGEGHSTTITFRLDSNKTVPQSVGEAKINELGELQIITHTPTEHLASLTQWAIETGTELLSLQVKKASLEDIFFRLTSVDMRRDGET